MAQKITNYQCPACTGPLQYDAGSGKLACEYCGSQFPVAEIEALYAEKEARAAQNAQAEEQKQGTKNAPNDDQSSWDTSGLQEDWGEDAQGMRVYSCPSCGAELLCEETTAATSCPYCGNPTVVPGQFSGTLRPDYIIPFKVKKAEAIAALKKHYEGRPLLPKTFKDTNHIQQIQGIYVPFWLFDGRADGSAHYTGTISRKYRSGDEEITETDHFDIFRQGKLVFRQIPVDGSKKMPDDYMDSIEPFDYREMADFSSAYLPGFLADKYDVTAEESSERADSRAKATILGCLRETVTGYETTVEIGNDIELERGAVKYALMPVWILTTKWQDKTYMFAMNGQTGKLVGDLPVDKKKRWSIFAAVYGIAALLTGAAVLFLGGLWNLLGF